MAISKEKKKAVDAIMGKINKKFGDKAVSYLVDVEEELRVKFWKTPSHEINAMLGGGFGKGKIIELYGNNSSGKTSLALEIIAKAQREDPEFMAVWVETEASMDPDYAATFGVDTDRFVFLKQSEELTAESCMDIIRGLVTSGEFGIVCLNSVAALTPKKEVEDELEKQNIALTARLLSKFLRITATMLDTNGTSLILINQVRQNLGAYIVTNTTTGGMAIPFYATQRIEMKKEKIMAGDPIKEEEGVKIRCRTMKNRLAKGNPYKMCNYYAIYGKGIDSTAELGAVLMREGIVTKGTWIYFPSKENMAKIPSVNGEVDAKWNGIGKFSDFLREDAVARKFFEQKLDEALAGGMTGQSVSEEEKAELEKMNQEIDNSEVSKEEEAV
jgi:recombination protein RecA